MNKILKRIFVLCMKKNILKSIVYSYKRMNTFEKIFFIFFILLYVLFLIIVMFIINCEVNIEITSLLITVVTLLIRVTSLSFIETIGNSTQIIRKNNINKLEYYSKIFEEENIQNKNAEKSLITQKYLLEVEEINNTSLISSFKFFSNFFTSIITVVILMSVITDSINEKKYTKNISNITHTPSKNDLLENTNK